MPVYPSRIPSKCIEDLKLFKGNNTTAIIVCVYGNRDYDESEMYKYISEYLRYPKTTEQGQSVIRFVVTEKGKVKDVAVLKSSGSKVLDNTAKKVVERMPDWEPGLKDGKPVSVYFSLPFNFDRP